MRVAIGFVIVLSINTHVTTASALQTTHNIEMDFVNSSGPLALESYESVAVGGGRLDPRIVVTPDLTTTAAGDSGGEVRSLPGNGQFATDGMNYLSIGGDSGGMATMGSSATFEFLMPVHEFGVSIIDFGDSFVEGDLTYSIDGSTPAIIASRPQPDGGEIFFGVVDSTTPFSQVVLHNTISGDSFAIDEVRYSAIPEPSTTVILSLTVVMLCGMRHGQQQELQTERVVPPTLPSAPVDPCWAHRHVDCSPI